MTMCMNLKVPQLYSYQTLYEWDVGVRGGLIWDTETILYEKFKWHFCGHLEDRWYFSFIYVKLVRNGWKMML